MKKNYFVKATMMLVVLLTATLFASCSKEEIDDPKTPFEYKAPCLNWHCTIDEVRTYMKSIKGYTEDKDVEKKSDGKLCYHFVGSNKSYSYTFDNKGLVECSYDDMNGTANFDKLKLSVTATHEVKEWKQEQTMSGVEWWTTTLKGRKTSIAIGKSENYGGYMYVNFQYDEFDW